MDEFLTVLMTAFQAVLVAVVPILTPFIIKWIKTYLEHVSVHLDGDKAKIYMDELSKAVAEAVAHTSQTYVEAVKSAKTFDAAAQKEALAKAVQTAQGMITKDAKKFLEEAYEDVGALISAKVEAAIGAGKAAAGQGSLSTGKTTVIRL